MNAHVLCGETATTFHGQTVRCTKPKGHEEKVEEHWDTEHRVGWTDPTLLAENHLRQLIDNAAFNGVGGKSLGWTARLIELVEQRMRLEAGQLLHVTCPGYETGHTPCRCCCEGCKHNCSAHNPDHAACIAEEPASG